jgi:hypothetical protein
LSFRGNALNPSCDEPGCHARAENPVAGKDFCGAHIGQIVGRYTRLTDAHRLAVLHEIYGEMRSSGGSTVVALDRYQDKIKARVKE